MYISHMALNRNVEEVAARDKQYRRDLEQSGRPLLSHGRRMSDDELLAKLRQLGFDAQRQAIEGAFPSFVSAEAMSQAMTTGPHCDIPGLEVDWVWIALTCLWERWQPDLPNLEMVDDQMQAGYAAQDTGDSVEACRLWLEAWRGILDIIDRAEIDSIDQFDLTFGGTQSVFNWIQDLEIELHNAGLEEPGFFHERIALCETVLSRFAEETLPTENFKSALAASHYELGDHETGDRLFGAWLEEEPQWGGGWIAWSDCHWLFAKAERRNAARAEQILQAGLASPGVEDKTHILERLQHLYEETGKDREAEDIRKQIAQMREPKTTATVRRGPDSRLVSETLDLGKEAWPREDVLESTQRPGGRESAADGFSVATGKVRRNDPCPCGSGKKFKKCCGRRDR